MYFCPYWGGAYVFSDSFRYSKSISSNDNHLHHLFGSSCFGIDTRNWKSQGWSKILDWHRFFLYSTIRIYEISIILLLSKYLSRHHKDLQKPWPFIQVLFLIISSFGLIMLQPDFGTGLVLVLSSILLLFNAGGKWKYFLILIGLGVVGLIALIASAPYRLTRIFAFLDPWSDPLGSGFQGIQALFAIAPSGLFGLGYNKSMQKHFFLPEPQNDFIFAIVCEELGLIGGVILLGLFLFLCIKMVKISVNVDQLYLKFLSLGIVLF